MSEQNKILNSMLNTPKNEEAQKTLDRGRAIINAMSEQKTEYKWNIERLEEMRVQHEMNPSLLATKQAYINALEYELNAATAEANKRMAELEGDYYRQLEFSRRVEKINDSLRANNHDLRKALENIKRYSSASGHANYHHIADRALSTTPAESLAKRDDEVIEKCAHTAKIYRANVSVIEAIRALKGK